MAKTLIVLILLFDGTLIQERYDLSRSMDVHDCLALGAEHREAVSTYNPNKNAWFLNDGRGTWQGHMCE